MAAVAVLAVVWVHPQLALPVMAVMVRKAQLSLRITRLILVISSLCFKGTNHGKYIQQPKD
jgi:hypothetical protein